MLVPVSTLNLDLEPNHSCPSFKSFGRPPNTHSRPHHRHSDSCVQYVVESKVVAMFVSPALLRLSATIAALFWMWHVVACMYWAISVREGQPLMTWCCIQQKSRTQKDLVLHTKAVASVAAKASVSLPQPPSGCGTSRLHVLGHLRARRSVAVDGTLIDLVPDTEDVDRRWSAPNSLVLHTKAVHP
jgi:hypothetical protein